MDASSSNWPGPRRRILVSAYACSPLWGSEPEVGWRWLLELAKLHDITLLTHGFFRAHLEPALADAGVSVTAHYFQPHDFGWHPHRQLQSRIYYLWWQLRARREVRRLIASNAFDLIHHLTWGTMRFPCLLAGLGVPLVMGPLGGGETAPARLFAGIPVRYRVFDLLRTASLSWIRIDPIASWGPRRSVLVMCRTRESLDRLPSSLRSRSVVIPDVGSPFVSLVQRRPAQARPETLRILFAGRLLAWKGVHLALGTVRRLLDAGLNVQLDVAGEGPLRKHLDDEIVRLGLVANVHLLGKIPRDELFAKYAEADIFLFPSLHDAGGTVVLEALSRGLPVICLDLGGPPNFVDSSCGAVVVTRGKSRAEVEVALAEAVKSAIVTEGQLTAWSLGAAARAKELSWANLVDRAYAHVHRRMGWVSVASGQEASPRANGVGLG